MFHARVRTDDEVSPLRVVIAGAGVGALEVATALQALAPGRVRLELVAPDERFTWRALQVAEPFGRPHANGYPLEDVVRELGAVLHRDRAAELDVAAHELRCRSGARVPYDVLVLALGGIPRPVLEAATTFDRSGEPEVFDEVLEDVRADFAHELLIVVPPEVRWSLPAYELALMSASTTTARVTLATQEEHALAVFGGEASAAVEEELSRAGVTFLRGVRCDVVSATAARLDGRWRTFDRIVAIPGMDGPGLPGAPHDDEGFILADELHRVPRTDDRVYAIGDGVAGTLKHGGMTAWAADRVALQIAATAGVELDGTLPAPVLRGLLATPDGPMYLQADPADPGSAVASRNALWWPPTKVAAPWLSPFLGELDARRLVR